MAEKDKDHKEEVVYVTSKPTVRIDPSTLLRYEEDVQSLMRILTYNGPAQSEIVNELMILRMLMAEAKRPPLKIQEAMTSVMCAKAAALDMLSFVTRRSSLNVVPPEKWKDVIGEVRAVSTRGLIALKIGLIEETKTSLSRLMSRAATKADWTNFCEVVALLSELPWEDG